MSRLGLVVALEKEAACVGGRSLPRSVVSTLDANFMVCVCGMGPQRAAEGAQALIDAGATHLLSVGTAAALSPELEPGDLVLPGEVAAADRRYPLDEPWRQRLVQQLSPAPAALESGLLVSVDEVVATPEAKSALARETGAVAVDMESAAVAGCAAAAGLPCAVVRVIVDPARLAVPAFVLKNCDAFGRPQLAALLGALLRNPRRLVSFLRLAQAFAASTRTLRWVGRRRHRLLPAAAAGACLAAAADL